MWQKGKDKKYHLLWSYDVDLDGCVVDTACGAKVKASPKDQEIFPKPETCEVCNSVWHLVCTSVDDARESLRRETNVAVLERTAMLTKSITLRRAAEARIRRIEKDKVKERKLRLLEKAYD